PDGVEQPGPADLVLEHRGAGLRAGAAVGCGRDAGPVLPELARVPVRACDRVPGDDETAADAARAAVEVDEVVDAPAGPEPVLGDRAQARVVADGRWQPGGLLDERAH